MLKIETKRESILKIKKLLLSLVFMIIFIILLTTKSNADAEMPKISISGDNSTASSNGTTPITYSLTIDYSEMSDLTNFKIYYKVNNNSYQEVNYDSANSSYNLTIFGGSFESGNHLQTIYVYAENDEGTSEVLEKTILVIYYASKSFTDDATGISGTLMQYPLNTTVEIETVTDSAILNKLPLLNMTTVYKVTPKVDGQDVGTLLKQYGVSTSTSYITLLVPVPENIAQMVSFGDQIGYVFAPNLTDYRTVTYMNNSTVNFTLSTATYIYNEGYAYYAIATGIDPNYSNNTNTNNSGTNNTSTTDNTTAPGTLPQTGQSSLTVILIIGIAVIGVVAIKRYNDYKDIA